MIVKTAYGLLKQTGVEWLEDKVPRLGAALAYYSVFSVAPLLLLATAIAGAVYGEREARDRAMALLQEQAGSAVAAAVDGLLQSASRPGASNLAALVSLGILLFAASGVFVQLQDSLNTIWGVEPRPGRGLLGIIRDRVLSFAMVLATGFFLLTSLVLSATLTVVNAHLAPDRLPGGEHLWSLVNGAVSVGLVTLLFAFLFKWVPDVVVPWRAVWPGALLTALGFNLGKYLLGLYIAHTSVTSAYGAAGSVVVLLLWVYYSSQILLFGAEFTQVYAGRRGWECPPTAAAVRVRPGVRSGHATPRPAETAPSVPG